jgi:hypothetical protein
MPFGYKTDDCVWIDLSYLGWWPISLAWFRYILIDLVKMSFYTIYNTLLKLCPSYFLTSSGPTNLQLALPHVKKKWRNALLNVRLKSRNANRPLPSQRLRGGRRKKSLKKGGRKSRTSRSYRSTSRGSKYRGSKSRGSKSRRSKSSAWSETPLCWKYMDYIFPNVFVSIYEFVGWLFLL